MSDNREAREYVETRATAIEAEAIRDEDEDIDTLLDLVEKDLSFALHCLQSLPKSLTEHFLGEITGLETVMDMLKRNREMIDK